MNCKAIFLFTLISIFALLSAEQVQQDSKAISADDSSSSSADLSVHSSLTTEGKGLANLAERHPGHYDDKGKYCETKKKCKYDKKCHKYDCKCRYKKYDCRCRKKKVDCHCHKKSYKCCEYVHKPCHCHYKSYECNCHQYKSECCTTEKYVCGYKTVYNYRAIISGLFSSSSSSKSEGQEKLKDINNKQEEQPFSLAGLISGKSKLPYKDIPVYCERSKCAPCYKTKCETCKKHYCDTCKKEVCKICKKEVCDTCYKEKCDTCKKKYCKTCKKCEKVPVKCKYFEHCYYK